MHSLTKLFSFSAALIQQSVKKDIVSLREGQKGPLVTVPTERKVLIYGYGFSAVCQKLNKEYR